MLIGVLIVVLKPTNVRSVPNNNASVVRPNAKPALPGREFEIATKVIGIVRLKKSAPKIPMRGCKCPNARSGAETNNPVIAIFIQPNLSPKIPPNAFPRTIAPIKLIPSNILIFQEKTKESPIKARMPIENNNKIIINSK